MAEEWRGVVGREDMYAVSSYGRIKNIQTGRILIPKKLPNGYLRVKISRPEKPRDVYVHRIVAEAFCEKSNRCNIVNHIDNDTTNNHADNLEWTTQRGNVMHAMIQNRVPNFPNAKAVGGIKDGNLYIFNSTHQAAEYVGCNHTTILHGIKTGRVAKGGFLWKELDAI